MSATEVLREGVTGARIAAELRSAILTGEYAPGARIRQEDLAARYGASRVPVREALRILEADGLVTLVANTGAWVARLSLAECEEMYRIREKLEPLLIATSIPGLGDQTIRRLEELATEMEAGTDVEAFLRLDREFHLLSYSGAETTLLGDLVHRLWNTTQHYRRAYTLLLDGGSNRIVHDEHHLLVTAIAAHDGEDAERVLIGHIRRTRLQLELHPELFDDLGTGRTPASQNRKDLL
ncbi:GntR family transcriptional regulator [Amnibacterium sp.]|uniref:GntR family transcriptional regulator n=1 Tax=Amnibacterium sp. TaxID=1872496 RepID=UPI00263979C3|nr:GntR family transcriptional regulator [Amnibacterium sp.]MCU1473275.1 transcriptional regulator, GntR family [Amnibacterium sp.]